MITFKKLGRNMGNLGNQLFQIATMYAFSKRYECSLMLPKWKYDKYFEHPVTSDIKHDLIPITDFTLSEDHFHYTPELWDQYVMQFRNQPVDINGWLQSEKYFKDYALDIQKIFQVKDVFVREVKNKMSPELYSRPVIVISIRRGDYVGNPNYDLLPIRYYIGALLEHFPNFRTEYNLLFLSDDIPYCKVHFNCLPNAYFSEGLNDIEQLTLGIHAGTHYIVANSTFSWWVAWLGQHIFDGPYLPEVIRPGYLFAGELLKRNDDRDFWPDDWTRFDHKPYKINLLNATFTVPVLYDSKDREQNVNLSLKLLFEDFDTNVIIGEQGSFARFKGLMDQYPVQHKFFDGMTNFHRTKMLNEMAIMAKTPIVVNWDADIIIPPMQIIEAYRMITEREADMVYPYDGRFARVPRMKWYNAIDSMSDTGMFGATVFSGMNETDAKSVGGAIMWHLQSFIDGGMENENMISYGPEDTERYKRYQKLGYKVRRIAGVLYHMDHALTLHSTSGHPLFHANVKEMEKVVSMGTDSLRHLVNNWPWKKAYTPAYYEGIVEDSERSANIILGLLDQDYKFEKIVDVGCGLGAWGKGLDNYIGIDYKVPASELLIPLDKYIEHDLTTPLYDPPKADLVLCMEVAEHLEEQYADLLIATLTDISTKYILFSAAIPGQGGVNHFNEQWQSYWAMKFARQGFRPVSKDIRDEFWDDDSVSLWYRQNVVLYQKQEIVEDDKLFYRQDGELVELSVGESGVTLTTQGERKHPIVFFELNRVHPRMYENILRTNRIIR